MKKNHFARKVARFSMINCLVCLAGAAVTGGTLAYFSLNHEQENIQEKAIVIGPLDNVGVIFEHTLFPGQYFDYKLSISTTLLDGIKYSLSFSEPAENEINNYLHVSMYHKDEELINKTLQQIYEESFTLENRELAYNNEDVYEFRFSVDLSVDFPFDVNFSINVKAEGSL